MVRSVPFGLTVYVLTVEAPALATTSRWAEFRDSGEPAVCVAVEGHDAVVLEVVGLHEDGADGVGFRPGPRRPSSVRPRRRRRIWRRALWQRLQVGVSCRSFGPEALRCWRNLVRPDGRPCPAPCRCLRGGVFRYG